MKGKDTENMEQSQLEKMGKCTKKLIEKMERKKMPNYCE